MMLNPINELTVWLDSLEDEGIDVSLARLLSAYNYLSVPFVYGALDLYGHYLTTNGEGIGTIQIFDKRYPQDWAGYHYGYHTDHAYGYGRSIYYTYE